MPHPHALFSFGLVALLMVLTPGPNMIYLVSRSLSQGPRAGLISLAGVATGFLVYLLCAALGVTALMLMVPIAYDALRIAGALYLLYLAWQAVGPAARSPFEVCPLGQDSPRRLFTMGLMTNLLNPKAALLYLSLLPQFIDPRGNVPAQFLVLGAAQIAISITVNAAITVGAGSIAGILRSRPSWVRLQRWVVGAVLGSLAVHIALQGRK